MTGFKYMMCAGVFAAAYSVNMLYITVFFHRAAAHGSLRIRPRLLTFVYHSGSWVTGLDMLAWVCMHRIHHANADGSDDPHSPAIVGISGVFMAQARSYHRIISGLINNDPELSAVVADLELDVHWLNRRPFYFPYIAHALASAILSFSFGGWEFAAAYLAGILGHPVQGWIVNAFGHASGSRNFETPDNSRNNFPAALFIWGEGLQNNHHAYPGSARFAYRWWEPDFGYAVCRMLDFLGLVEIRRDALMPRPS